MSNIVRSTVSSKGVSLDNEVIFNSESMFPTQDATTITLEAGMNYVQGADVSTTKRFIVEPGSSITANNIFAPILTYTGTGAMFTGDNASFSIHDIAVSAPNSDKYFDWPETTPFSSIINMSGATFIGGAEFGDFGNIAAIAFSLCNATSLSSGGITLTGTNNILFSVDRVALVSSSASFKGIDLGSAVITTIDINNLVVVAPSGAFGISGLANNGNIPSGILGKITNCNFTGGMTGTGLENITKDDVRWTFRANNTIPDTRNAVDLFLQGGSETITIGSSGEWHEIGVPSGGGVSWGSNVASRFTTSSAGVATYIGERDLDVVMSGRATVEKVGGGSDILEARIAINWTGLITDGGLSKTRAQTENNRPTTIPVGGLMTLSNGDDIRIIFSNVDGGSNIIANVSTLEITG